MHCDCLCPNLQTLLEGLGFVCENGVQNICLKIFSYNAECI